VKQVDSMRFKKERKKKVMYPSLSKVFSAGGLQYLEDVRHNLEVYETET
jgi:hypothetical protein